MERTRRPCHFKISEFLFAGDTAAVGTSRRGMEKAASVLKSVISQWGLVLSIPKPKMMFAGTPCSGEDELKPLHVR